MADPTYLYQQAASGPGTGTVNLSEDPPVPTLCYKDFDCDLKYESLTPCIDSVCDTDKRGTVDGNCFYCSKGAEIGRVTHEIYSTVECENE